MSRLIRPERRRFLKQAGLAMLAAAIAHAEGDAQAPDAVPNSTGTASPRITVPVGACDCHHHIYDAARFPPSDPIARMIANATISDYRLLQRRLGFTRNVIVTPAPYVGDNRVTVDALRAFGKNARAVALLRPDVTDKELKALNDAGVRGARFSVGNPGLGNPSSIDMIDPLTRRIEGLGWHAQIYMRADQIVAYQAVLNRVATPIVFDHMGVLLPEGLSHPAFSVLRRLIDRGHTWVKLSAPNQQARPDGTGSFVMAYDAEPAAAGTVARGFIAAAPERMIWGSNWPHPGDDPTRKPDDAAVVDQLRDWAPDERTRHRILVENPESLYGFSRG